MDGRLPYCSKGRATVTAMGAYKGVAGGAEGVSDTRVEAGWEGSEYSCL